MRSTPPPYPFFSLSTSRYRRGHDDADNGEMDKKLYYEADEARPVSVLRLTRARTRYAAATRTAAYERERTIN